MGSILIPSIDNQGMTLISTTTLSGGTTTISNIPTGYVNLMLVLRDQTSGDNTSLRMRVNADTGNVYRNFTASGAGSAVATYFEIGVLYSVGTNYEYGTGQIVFYDYSNTIGFKTWQSVSSHTREADDNNPQNDLAYGVYYGGLNLGNTSAISSITFIPSTGTGLGGTALLYGVK